MHVPSIHFFAMSYFFQGCWNCEPIAASHSDSEIDFDPEQFAIQSY